MTINNTRGHYGRHIVVSYRTRWRIIAHVYRAHAHNPRSVQQHNSLSVNEEHSFQLSTFCYFSVLSHKLLQNIQTCRMSIVLNLVWTSDVVSVLGPTSFSTRRLNQTGVNSLVNGSACGLLYHGRPLPLTRALTSAANFNLGYDTIRYDTIVGI